jgi:hypothetical protein
LSLSGRPSSNTRSFLKPLSRMVTKIEISLNRKESEGLLWKPKVYSRQVYLSDPIRRIFTYRPCLFNWETRREVIRITSSVLFDGCKERQPKIPDLTCRRRKNWMSNKWATLAPSASFHASNRIGHQRQRVHAYQSPHRPLECRYCRRVNISRYHAASRISAYSPGW